MNNNPTYKPSPLGPIPIDLEKSEQLKEKTVKDNYKTESHLKPIISRQ